MLAEIRLTDCTVGGSCLIGREGMGIAVATGALDIGRYSVACGCVGIIQACLESSVAYASGRTQGGFKIAEHQLVRRMITDMATSARAARLLCAQAGRLKDEGDPDTITATCIAKYFAARAAMSAASDTVQIHGANGCLDGHPAARFFRDAKIMEIIEGSTQIQQILIANAALQGQHDPELGA
jgi:alkylation response protein AidB-like acyl-CoA dehydrogenase